jgi:hypothetical protein
MQILGLKEPSSAGFYKGGFYNVFVQELDGTEVVIIYEPP